MGGKGRRTGRQAVITYRLRAARRAAVLTVVLACGGALIGPAAQASQPRPVLPAHQASLGNRARDWLSLPSGLRLWRPAYLRGTQYLHDTPWSAPAGGPLRSQAGTWRVERTPNPAVQRDGLLLASSCARASACVAVGSAYGGAGLTVPLAERWNGSGWAIQVVPRPAGATWSSLTGVSCTSATGCTAVGYYYTRTGHIRPLAERWDGTRWRIQLTASPAGSPASGFFAVSCTSDRACTAVGDYATSLGKPQTLTERWNGSRWAIQPSPNPVIAQDSGLFAVSCAGSRACTAAGSYTTIFGGTQTLAEVWDGTSWTIQSTPNPAAGSGGGFLGVSCTSALACTAVGDYTTSTGNGASLAERRDGSRWTIQAVPGPAGALGSALYAVSCVAAGACTAAGVYAGDSSDVHGSGSEFTAPLAETWNGGRWAVQAARQPGGSTAAGFTAISCVPASACRAVGSYSPGPGQTDVPLAEAWNGTRWAIQATPSRAGAAADSEFTAISCPSARACAAVGFFTRTPFLTVTLAEAWDGTRWRIQPTPSPGAVSSTLAGVSCTSPRACTAVGAYSPVVERQLAFAEAWNGTRWAIHATPAPARTSSSALQAVSCTSPRACTAVGYYTRGSGSPRPLAERWNGTRWAIQAAPSPPGASGVQLQGVSCPSARTCVAVGIGGAGPVAERWNGTRWTARAVPLPAGASGGILQAVSCTSPHACTATGSLFARPGGAWAVRWNGSTWSTQATPRPPNYTQSTSQITLSAVSCTSDLACTAIGNYDPYNQPTMFTEAWNGTRWRLLATATPAGTTSNFLGGVSCIAVRCTAAGAYTGRTPVVVTLAITSSGG